MVAPDAAPNVRRHIAARLRALTDRETGLAAVHSVSAREDVYAGEYLDRAPDLIVGFGRGYRASWGTARGAVPATVFENNERLWSGDHVVAPELVPGVLFASQRFRMDAPRMVDLAPTVLAALGVPKGVAMEGTSLLV